MLNKSKGNMYPWVTHTWNVVKGKCPHDCLYCYMKRHPQPELHFDEKELKTDLGQGNTIFVGSSCDMWAVGVPMNWIQPVMEKCIENVYNRYLFQSKNPLRFAAYRFPDEVILGTTIESNRHYPLISKASAPHRRMDALIILKGKKMVNIEPILEFDINTMLMMIKMIEPEFVSIGADSGNNHLPEPSGDKVKALISELEKITQVKIKDNLGRLLK